MCRTKYLIIVIIASALFIVLGIVAILYRPHETVRDVSFDTELIPEQGAVVVNAIEKDVTVRDRLKARLAASEETYTPEPVLEVGGVAVDVATTEAASLEMEQPAAAELTPMPSTPEVNTDLCAETACVSEAIIAPPENMFVGLAEDGTPRFAQTENGTLVSTAEVDVCLGHTHDVLWEGVVVSLYHYHDIVGATPAPECFQLTESTVME